MRFLVVVLMLVCAGCASNEFELADYEQWRAKPQQELSQEMLMEGSSHE